MKLVFFVIVIVINFFNYSSIKSEEKIDSGNKKIENTSKRELIPVDETEIRKIHIVKTGDTISSISKFYSISKDSIIKLNNLKDENYIFVGQNLIISESSENSAKKSDLRNSYHIVQIGDSLTDLSNKYKLNLGYLIEINNLKNPDYVKVGEKLLLRKNKQIYGPLIIQNKSFKEIKGRKVLNVLNKENKKLILSINCDTNELDVKKPGRKWMGGKYAKEEFEKNLINDFC